MEYKYYCKKCEEFFTISYYGTSRCPRCFATKDMLLGPFPVKEYEI